MTYLLALDQGTSSSRSIVFDADGRIVAMAQREFRQIYPQPGWVEHDPEDLWQTQLATAQEALAKASITAAQVKAIGITNQRETTVVWNRRTGRPIHNAIVWQDRRGEPLCAQLRDQSHAEAIRRSTGLVVDAYFSATKLEWLLDHVPGMAGQDVPDPYYSSAQGFEHALDLIERQELPLHFNIDLLGVKQK